MKIRPIEGQKSILGKSLSQKTTGWLKATEAFYYKNVKAENIRPNDYVNWNTVLKMCKLWNQNILRQK